MNTLVRTAVRLSIAAVAATAIPHPAVPAVSAVPTAATPASPHRGGSPSADSLWFEDELIAEALRANPAIGAARARIDVAQARALRAGAWPAPTVSFEFYNTPITSLNPLHDGLENDYAVQQMIPLSGMPGLMRDMADAQTRMERAATGTRERELVRDLRSDIAMLMGTRARLRINEENHRLIEQVLRSVEAAYAVGRARQADVLRVRVDLERSVSERLALQAEAARGEAMINARLNRPAADPVPDIRMAPLAALQVPDTDPGMITRTADGRGELHMMAAEAEMARTQETLASRAWIPELMLRAMYKEMTMGMPDSWALMVGVNIPFAPWSQPAVRGAREEAAAQRREVALRTDEMRAMVGMQQRDTHSRAAALRDRLDRYTRDVLPTSAQSVAAALAAFGGGSGDFNALLDAARMHGMLRMEAAMIEADFRAAHAAMTWADGDGNTGRNQ